MNKFQQFALITIAGTLISGCATTTATQQPRPIGAGTSPNTLRSTPCACKEQPNPGSLPAFLAEQPVAVA